MSETIADHDESDEPEDHADRLFSMLRWWGLAEFALDGCLMSIMSRHETRDPLPPYPATLERKLGYLKEAIGLYPALAGGEEYMAQAVRLLTDQKKLRNDIVHGAPIKQLDDGTTYFMVLERRKGGLPHYALRTVRGEDWAQLDTTSIIAFAFLAQLEQLIRDTAPLGPGLHQGKKISSKGGVGLLSHLPISKALRKLLEELHPSLA